MHGTGLPVWNELVVLDATFLGQPCECCAARRLRLPAYARRVGGARGALHGRGECGGLPTLYMTVASAEEEVLRLFVAAAKVAAVSVGARFAARAVGVAL